MVAQRKTISTTRTTTPRRCVAVGQAQQTASSGDDDVDPACELLALQAMRADALAWVAEIERRIEALQMSHAVSREPLSS